jgi:exonuclease VII large subunit
MEQLALTWEPARRAFTVSELTFELRTLICGEFRDVWVSGEISGVKLPSSGHYYFTLKDEGAQLRCVCYRMTARYLKFKPQDGVLALARGRLDVYDARGEVQMIVEMLEPQGAGALQFAFEQLKQRLAAEGLFDPARLHRNLGRRMQRIDELDYRLRDLLRANLDRRKRAFNATASRLARLDVRLHMAEARRRLEGCEARIQQAMHRSVGRAQAALGPLEAHLKQLSPLKILERGYAIVERDGKLVKSPVDAPVGSDVRVRLAQGELGAKVTRAS